MMDWLWSLQLPLSVLLILLLLIHPLLLRRLGARTLYALWLSVPLLLLLSLLLPYIPVADLRPERISVTLKHLPQPTVTTHDSALLQGLWLAGFGLGAVIVLCLHWPMIRLYKTAQKIAQYDPLPCYQTPQHVGPYVSGFWQPRIFLPADFAKRFDSQQQQLILQHEMTHWRRGDLHLNYVALALLLLFWFNPLVWLAYRRYRQDQELSCDALVLQDAKPQDRIAYGYALISNLQQARSVWQPLTYHYGDKIMMQQRLLQIQQSKGMSKVAVCAGLSLLVLAGLWMQPPVYAEQTSPSPIMRIEPLYPIQAAEQRITGYVQAQFNIQPDGTVTDVKIIKSEPAAVFDKEAVRALEKWRYGTSQQGVKGAMVQLDFMLDSPETEMEQIKVTPSVQK